MKLSDRPSGVPPIHFRGDSIVPITFIENLFRYNTSNTEEVRRGDFFLLVIPGKTKTATGDLFWDDGESIITIESGKYNYYTFKLHSNCSLEINVVKSGYDLSSEPQIIKEVVIFGTDAEDIEYSIDEKEWMKIKPEKNYIKLEVNIDLNSKKSGEKWVINWKSLKTNSCNIK